MSLKAITTKQVVSLPADATVQEAAKMMRDSHVGDIVVVKNKGDKKIPIGIVTDRDIVMSSVAFGLAPSSVTLFDVMRPTVTVAQVTDSFYHVLNLMKEHGIKRVPIVHADGSLAGIVSTEDIVALLAFELNDVVKIKKKQLSVEAEQRRKFA